MRKSIVIVFSLFVAAASFAATPTFAADQKYSEATRTTQQIGEKYFAAYIARDWDTIDPLLADNASFRDGTAELVFGGVIQTGKPAVIKLFRDGYASIDYMRFQKLRSYFAGNYAIFEGSLDWALKLDDGRVIKSVMPFSTILRIEKGKIVEHRDYADYAPFIASMKNTPKPE